jgi:hypothetical protein
VTSSAAVAQFRVRADCDIDATTLTWGRGKKRRSWGEG